MVFPAESDHPDLSPVEAQARHRAAETLSNLHTQPVIVDIEGDEQQREAQIEEMLNRYPDAEFCDFTQSYYEAYCKLRYPTRAQILQIAGKKEEWYAFCRKKLTEMGVGYEKIALRCARMVYFPFDHSLIAYPSEKILYQVRTASNRGITQPEVQKKHRETRYVVIGLSVGSSIAWALQAKGARNILGLDNDVVDGPNLNRLLPGCKLSVSKAALAEHFATLLDPYHQSSFIQERFTVENGRRYIEQFQPDFIIDECDDVGTKELLRKLAKEFGIIVISAADIGPGTVRLDVEDYKNNPDRPIFHGITEAVTEEYWNSLDQLQKIVLLNNVQEVPSEMISAVIALAEGRLGSFSQEIGAVSLSASTILMAIETILSGGKVPDQIVINLGKILNLDYLSTQRNHSQLATDIKNLLGLQ